MPKCKNPDLGRLLHAYELNALSEEDAERFEIHLLGCEHCFSELKAFEEAAALLRSDQELTELASEVAADLEGSRESLLGRAWRHLWPETPWVFKPALAYLIILLLIIPAYRGLKKSEISHVNPPQVITLLSEKSQAEGTFQAGMNYDGVLRFELRDALANRSYLVMIESEGGEAIYRNHDFNAFDEYGWGELIFPHAEMIPGCYKLVIAGPRAWSGQDTTYYYFTVVP